MFANDFTHDQERAISNMHTLKHELRQQNPDVVTLRQLFRNNGQRKPALNNRFIYFQLSFNRKQLQGVQDHEAGGVGVRDLNDRFGVRL